MEKYKKLTSDLFIARTTAPDPISLSELRAERDRLIAQQAAEEPSDEELLAWAKREHPYYTNVETSVRINDLNQLIQDLSEL